MDLMPVETKQRLVCAHCSLTCSDDSIAIGDKVFCCNGCKKVYELLHSNEMCTYYSLDDQAGVTPSPDDSGIKYGFLDNSEIQQQLYEFFDGSIAKVTFTIPSMHCASCIWLLEQLSRFNTGITQSRVNFVRREVTVTFHYLEVSLREVVELLALVGYEPRIRLEDVKRENRSDDRRKLYLQIGVAGFAFGNIMMFSFPEYLVRGGDQVSSSLRFLFMLINSVLILPVVFFSGRDYLISAWKGLRHKIVNLDVPISLGIMALFGRSYYEVLSGFGVGYFDSLSGLIFFLLLGKLFQAKTYETLSFERDYTSYFPIAVVRLEEAVEKSVPVMSLQPGDRIIIRNQELIPTDSVLINGKGGIDYSFVTGESQAVHKNSGDVIYAGGRQMGEAIELEVIEAVSQSYLTELWRHDSFNGSGESGFDNLANSVSKYFVAGVLLIATLAFSYHAISDISEAFKIFTSVLIIACPCALALATPFTLGTAMRLLGRQQFYLKDVTVVERLAKINRIVFDKTGTLTDSGAKSINWNGDPLSESDKMVIKSLVRNSVHPISMKLNGVLADIESREVEQFAEYTGKGIEGIIDGNQIKVGSLSFVGSVSESVESVIAGDVYVSICDEIIGSFSINSSLRTGIKELVERLQNRLSLSLISGDSDHERATLAPLFTEQNEMLFEQSPKQKLNYIDKIQKSGQSVLMIGDGLNDAGALKVSDVGIAITDDITAFSPASDALLTGESLQKLDQFIKFSRASVRVIIAGFVLSILYNSIGLGFAVTGKLSPLVSAILMPLSSITVVAFATFTTNLVGIKIGLKN